MRLCARRSCDKVAPFDGDPFFAPAIFTLPCQHVKQLVHDVMAVERKRLLARRHDVQRAAERLKTEHRSDAAPLHGKPAAVAALEQRHVGNIEDRTSTHPTEPSSETEISFCASTANSIGNCCSTSLTKPLTTSAVASSADNPRCRQ